MQTHILGYPRIGSKRELKKACEQYWSGKILLEELLNTGRTLCNQNWNIQKEAGIDLIPCNDFSYYDQVLDMSLVVGAIPTRYHEVVLKKNNTELDLYFAMARGYQKDGLDITAMEMTKWFDTNYHYLVPELAADQEFRYSSKATAAQVREALALGIATRPVVIGPLTFLRLAKRTDGYPVTYFNKADPDLFAKVIRQFQPQYQMSEIMAGIGTSNAASGTVPATHRRH